MHFNSINQSAYAAFAEWLLETPSEELRRAAQPESATVADYIYDWMSSGKGVYACHGSFEVYLVVVILIINGWSRMEASSSFTFDYVEYIEGEDGVVIGHREHKRPVNRILHERSNDDVILDRNFFEQCVFRTLHGQPAPSDPN